MNLDQGGAAAASRMSFHRGSLALHLGFLGLLLVAVWSAFGCKKREPAQVTPASIHSITKELADAARTAAPSGTDIRLGLQASAKNPAHVDQLDITLPKARADSQARMDIAKIQQQLGAVATRHGLTQEPRESHEGISFYYLKGAARTHVVQIHFTGPPSGQAGSTTAPSNGPMLAIILDDLGGDWHSAEEIFELSYPLTISVLPNHEHSNEIAQEAERRGYQVLLHLPMQAIATEKPEAQELRPGMPATQVATLVDQFLQNVPGAVGVNNHQGSQATADPALMGELMPVLRDRHLFFIDSRTTAATVAYDTAHADGVASAFRNIPFLDDVAQVGPVRKQLELALRGAREKGQAVAIGHPHPATLQAMRQFLPTVQAQGVRLVFASDLVH